MAVRIQLRRDSASNWELNNPVLALGEIGLDITSGNFKIGNGIDPWTQLNYFSTEVEDVISQQQLNDAIAAIGGDGLVFDSQNGVYDIDLSQVSQDIIPDADETYDLGSSSKRWNDLYLSGNTIFLGDIQLKDNGDGTFGVFGTDGSTTLETVLLEGQVTDFELSNDSADIKARFAAHRDATDNPHSVTAEQVGLGNVTNESKATMFTDPTFTGTVSGVTATMVGLGNVTNESKETMFTNTALTGVPTAPTPATSTNTTQIATAAFVQSEINSAALALGTNYSVADIAARDSLQNLVVGDVVFVADDGDNKWAQYKVTAIGPVTFLKIMDQDIFLNALSAADVKAAYESNADTNAFTDTLLSKLNGIEENAKDDQDADEVPYVDTNQTYALGSNVQTAIYAIDDELIAQDGRLDTAESDITGVENRLDTIEGDDQTAGSIAKALQDAKDYADTQDALQDAADEISYSDASQIYALGSNVQTAIYAIDDELIAQDGRLDTIEGDDQTAGSIAKALQDAKDYADTVAAAQDEADEITYDNTTSGLTATNIQTAIDEIDGDLDSHIADSTIHFTQAQISITESQINDLKNYELADSTILKNADIGITVQGYNVNTVIDQNYETFDSSATYANLRAQATTADDVGLGNVTNESKATMFTDPTFTGIPTAPTANELTDTTQIATTAFVQGEISRIGGDGIVLDNNTKVYNLDLTSISQNITPSIDETYNLGSPTKKWKDIFLSGTSIYLGDVQLRDNGDGTFGIYSVSTGQIIETALKDNQVTDTQLSNDSEDIKARFVAHRDAINNPHSVTSEQVGLGNVTNESKQTMFTDPTFTGTVSGVTAAMVGLGNVTNESKATMFIDAALTGVPTAPTATLTTNTTQIATTEFVISELNTFALGLNRSFSVATIAERDALTGLNVGDFVFVADDGDGSWAQYKLTDDDPKTFTKIMDQDIFLNALSAPDIKAAYESNEDTNAFTDSLKTRLETTGTNYIVANIAARDNITNLVDGDIIYVDDDGFGNWVVFIVYSIVPGEFLFGQIMHENIYNNAITEDAIKTAYESNPNTNAFTDLLLEKLNDIEENAKDDQNASEVPYDNNSRTYITSTTVQGAISDIDVALVSKDDRIDIIEGGPEVEGSIAKALADSKIYTDDEILVQSNRLDIIEGDNVTEGSIAKALQDAKDHVDPHIDNADIHFTMGEISISESQISDLATYLQPLDIGVTIQPYDENTVIDQNYETFNSSGTYLNLRAQATTAEDVGLENVTNESKATMFTDAALTGIPTAPTAAAETNTTQIATTAFVQEALAGAQFIDGGEF